MLDQDHVVTAAATVHRHQSPADQTVREEAEENAEEQRRREGKGGDTDVWARTVSQRRREGKKREMGPCLPTGPNRHHLPAQQAVSPSRPFCPEPNRAGLRATGQADPLEPKPIHLLEPS